MIFYNGIKKIGSLSPAKSKGCLHTNMNLTDLYKIVGNYVIGAVQRKKPQKKRRGRRRKTELTGEEGDLPLIGVDGEAEADDDTEE